MTLSTACPKPSKRTESAKRVDQLVKAWSRTDRWRQQAIAKAKGKPRTKVKERNEKRIAKKHAAYRKVIASDFHRRLRYEAWIRSNGFCECDLCVMIRKVRPTELWACVQVTFPEDSGIRSKKFTQQEIARAWTPVPVWFVNKGGEIHRRFRSTEGELHHTGNYPLFGKEDPAELQHVQWTWKECHRRIEAEHGTRRRFLSGRK